MSDTDNTLTGTFTGDLDNGIEVKSAIFKRGTTFDFAKTTNDRLIRIFSEFS